MLALRCQRSCLLRKQGESSVVGSQGLDKWDWKGRQGQKSTMPYRVLIFIWRVGGHHWIILSRTMSYSFWLTLKKNLPLDAPWIIDGKNQGDKLRGYYIFFISSTVGEHLGCFHVLAIVNSTTMNITVHVSFWIMVFFEYMPRSGIAGSHDHSLSF